MALSADEELRLKCLELASVGSVRNVLSRARAYYKFAKGDKKESDKPQPLPQYNQKDEAARVMGMIRPT